MILGRRWFRQEDTLQATHGFVRRLFASLVMPLHLTTTPVSSRSHHTSTSSAKKVATFSKPSSGDSSLSAFALFTQKTRRRLSFVWRAPECRCCSTAQLVFRATPSFQVIISALHTWTGVLNWSSYAKKQPSERAEHPGEKHRSFKTSAPSCSSSSRGSWRSWRETGSHSLRGAEWVLAVAPYHAPHARSIASANAGLRAAFTSLIFKMRFLVALSAIARHKASLWRTSTVCGWRWELPSFCAATSSMFSLLSFNLTQAKRFYFMFLVTRSRSFRLKS